jgi:hypothetical protein
MLQDYAGVESLDNDYLGVKVIDTSSFSDGRAMELSFRSSA